MINKIAYLLGLIFDRSCSYKNNIDGIKIIFTRTNYQRMTKSQRKSHITILLEQISIIYYLTENDNDSTYATSR